MISDSSKAENGIESRPVTRQQEFVAFIILAILIWPVLPVGVVGGYGFIVWMAQMVFGPPGPPR